MPVTSANQRRGKSSVKGGGEMRRFPRTKYPPGEEERRKKKGNWFKLRQG